MQLTKTLVAAVLAASTALGAPAEGEISMMAANIPQWTIENLKRVCNNHNSKCVWTFGINTHLAPPTACTLKVEADTASEASGGPANCGDFTVTSGWSGQFGPGNGFTVLSVVYNPSRLITWPSYTDKQVQSGQVVKPDQSYAPQRI